MRKLRTAAVVLSAFAFSTGAYAEGDVDAGKKVFKKCKACHNVDKEKNKVGPHLVGVIDRAAAAVEGYKYSKAMKAKAEEGLMWTEENIDTYLLKPKDFVPKTKMAFPGLKKPEDRVNVIAYMKSVAKAE